MAFAGLELAGGGQVDLPARRPDRGRRERRRRCGVDAEGGEALLLVFGEGVPGGGLFGEPGAGVVAAMADAGLEFGKGGAL
ncbi:hypothetical protein [Streptomyces albus]|uniref:hypothetical protein n=1 Tax=Streptomyces TaxID=1883 RepID=UPI001F29E048|nr:hypothetical protein [Streptomyces albus]UVN58846.1 hypothetical protein NR995_33105 [Streptomyces albus]